MDHLGSSYLPGCGEAFNIYVIIYFQKTPETRCSSHDAYNDSLIFLWFQMIVKSIIGNGDEIV